MPNKNTSPMRRVATLAAAGAAVLAFAGPAQAADCGQPTTTKAFSAFGDNNDYFTAPDGGFEAGGYGWTKSYASVVSGGEPWHGGGKAMQLSGNGSSVTSPAFCIDIHDPTVRLFYKTNPTGGVDGSYLKVEVVISSLIGTTSQIIGTVSPNTSWGPTPAFDLAGAAAAHLNSGLQNNDTATLKLKFTVVNGGSSYTIDDVDVDPFRGG
jgi:hypothetical protein